MADGALDVTSNEIVSLMVETERSVILKLSRALQKIITTPPRIISSPHTQPRRAAVAIILRVCPSPSLSTSLALAPPPPTLADFFSNDWVNAPDARAEILFLQREKASVTPVEAAARSQETHVAFPGGRMEEGDEGGMYTAMRQTWEEIGLDLAEKDYICVGQLDDREITTSLGKRLLMILSPFVFLQVTPHAHAPDPSEGTALHWTPLSTLANTKPLWSYVTVDIASRLAPKNSAILRVLIRALIGSMQFSAVVLKSDDRREKNESHFDGPVKLWGLTLGMTLDLLAHMNSAPVPGPSEMNEMLPRTAAPSMTSVFPRFSYPDVNFWIWVFGKRYREVIRGWETSIKAGGSNDRRINWMGTALNAFYGSVRKALVLVIVLRAIGILLAGGYVAWWILTS